MKTIADLEADLKRMEEEIRWLRDLLARVTKQGGTKIVHRLRSEVAEVLGRRGEKE